MCTPTVRAAVREALSDRATYSHRCWCIPTCTTPRDRFDIMSSERILGSWAPPAGMGAVEAATAKEREEEAQSPTCGGTAHLLPRERARASFDTLALTYVLDGGPKATMRRRWLWSEGAKFDNAGNYYLDREALVAQHVKVRVAHLRRQRPIDRHARLWEFHGVTAAASCMRLAASPPIHGWLAASCARPRSSAPGSPVHVGVVNRHSAFKRSTGRMPRTPSGRRPGTSCSWATRAATKAP